MQGMYDTITVWNKYTKGTATTYYKHTVENCYWRAHIVRNVSGTTVSLGTAWTVTVEAQAAYMPYAKWAALPDEQKPDYFTFNAGDIVAYGERNEIITPANATQMYNAMKPDVFTVKVVDDRSQEWKQAPHIKIEGV